MKFVRRLRFRAIAGGFAAWLAAGSAHAGPPFLSNDPDPPERGQWEVILPSTLSRSSDGTASGEWTTFDFNYGYDERTQLSAGLPIPFVRDAGRPRRSGLGDAFIEYKRRFGVEPQRGYFGIDPEVAFPTGDPDRGLGAGKVTAELPLLYQRRWGAWTAYADTRYKWRGGDAGRSYWFYGAVLEHRILDRAEIGVELYGNSSRREGGWRHDRIRCRISLFAVAKRQTHWIHRAELWCRPRHQCSGRTEGLFLGNPGAARRALNAHFPGSVHKRAATP